MVVRHQIRKLTRQSVCQDFCDEFCKAVYKANWSEIMNFFSPILLRQECDICRVEEFKISKLPQTADIAAMISS